MHACQTKFFFSLRLWIVLVSKIFEEVLEVDGGEIGVDEGEDDPVCVAQLLHHLVHLHAEIAFPSCWKDICSVNASNESGNR